jgi:DNA-directed RNA polymerase subunit E'/Rpb7
MDPLFERRELTRNIHIDAKFLQRNIHASILAQLRMKYEGICVAEGYINPRSITVVEHSLGRANLIRGGIDYVVRFQADVCMPHPGQVFRAPISLKSKIGIHAELTPVKALLPRDLHIGNGEFEEAEEKQEIEFEVVGSRFQQGDESIIVLAKLRNVVRPQVEVEASGSNAGASEPLLAAPVPGEGQADGKKVVTVDVASTKAAEQSKRKRLRATGEAKANESKPEGSA